MVLVPVVVVANDAQDDLNACDGLPAKQSHQSCIEDDVGVASPVLAFLHLGRNSSGTGDEGGHAEACNEVRANKKFAVVDVSNGNAADVAGDHDGEDGGAPDVVALVKSLFGEGFFFFAGGHLAGDAPLPAEVARVEGGGEEGHHHDGVDEVEAEFNFAGEGDA